jgi:D-alanyl-D-alanine carboxypeptidase/D-alanyl-D-alanine-endopeptidase (penicillin-binding protein 4)
MFNVFAVFFAAVIFGAPPPTPAPSPTPTLPPLPHAAGTAWTPAQIAAFRSSIAKLLQAKTLRGAQIGLYAIDTDRHTTIFSRNTDEEFMPASNFKLLVGSTAAADLGKDFSFVTRVTTDGKNLYLAGGGDAHLTATDLDDAAAALASQGVRAVSGDVITDATRYDDQRYGYGWSWDDLPYYYAPVVTALELEDGVVHMTLLPAPAAGQPATLRVWPESSAYSILDDMMTGPLGSKDTSDIGKVWNQPDIIRMSGSYPLGSKESGDVVPAVPDPESYAGDVFVRALKAHGIPVSGTIHSGKTPADARVLWSHSSAKLPELLAQFWYPSDNLMGELFLKELGVLQGGAPGSDDKGKVLERAFLRGAGVDPWTVTIGDGSGLSQYNRITPHDLVDILQTDWNGANRVEILQALPVSGKRGTLGRAYIGTPAENVVFAKTGSMSHIRTISGFVQTKTHGPVTFSFLINDWQGEDDLTGAADLAKVRAAVLSQFALQ